MLARSDAWLEERRDGYSSQLSPPTMPNRRLTGNWHHTQAAVREYWPRLTEQEIADLADIAEQRDALMRLLKARYEKSYGEIDREVTEFELRDFRSAHASRPSLGIQAD
jgi:hypothetical protein